MSGQGAIAEFVRLGAGLRTLVILAAGKPPIPVELVAPGVGGERCRNVRPRHIPMPCDVPVSYGVGNPLVAKLVHQPFEDRRSVMVFDCSNEAGCDGVIPEIVDPRGLASNGAYPANKRSGVPDALGLTRNGDPAWHVRSTQLTGVERRCRRRCTVGLSESTGDLQEFERPGGTRRPCGLASRRE